MMTCELFLPWLQARVCMAWHGMAPQRAEEGRSYVYMFITVARQARAGCQRSANSGWPVAREEARGTARAIFISSSWLIKNCYCMPVLAVVGRSTCLAGVRDGTVYISARRQSTYSPSIFELWVRWWANQTGDLLMMTMTMTKPNRRLLSSWQVREHVDDSSGGMHAAVAAACACIGRWKEERKWRRSGQAGGTAGGGLETVQQRGHQYNTNSWCELLLLSWDGHGGARHSSPQ